MAERGSAADWAARVGQRVVVRHRSADGRPTDAVGELLAVRPGTGPGPGPELVLATARGAVTVPLDAVLAGKAVPPRPSRPGPPHRALSLAALEQVATQHWAPADRQPLGDWLLRAAGGFTDRANSVLVQGDPGCPLDQALAAVRGWYAARGLPARASLAVPMTGPAGAPGPVTGPPPDPDLLGLLLAPPPGRLRPPVDAAAQWELQADLQRLGWSPRSEGSAYTLTAATSALLPRAGRPQLPAELSLHLAREPDAGWLSRYRPGAAGATHARALLLSAPDQVFAAIRSTTAQSAPAQSAAVRSAPGRSAAGGEPQTVAVARGSLAAGWAGVGAVDVVPALRRPGLARFLLAELAGWAWDRGARSTFLQVAVDNPDALRLYLSAGFTGHHRYDYLGPPP